MVGYVEVRSGEEEELLLRGFKLKVRRFISRVNREVQEVVEGEKEEGRRWQMRVKLRANVQIMKKVLFDSPEIERVDPKLLTELQTEFQLIEDQLKTPSPHLETPEIREKSPSSISETKPTQTEKVTRSFDKEEIVEVTSEPEPVLTPEEVQPVKSIEVEPVEGRTPLTEEQETAQWIEGLRRRRQERKSSDKTRNSGESDGEGEAELLRQQHLQDELAGSLVSMAGVLKSNTMAFGDALHRDGQVLDEAQSALDSNLDRLTAEGRRLALLNASTSRSTLLYYLAVLFVILVFIMTAVFIRITAKRF